MNPSFGIWGIDDEPRRWRKASCAIAYDGASVRFTYGGVPLCKQKTEDLKRSVVSLILWSKQRVAEGYAQDNQVHNGILEIVKELYGRGALPKGLYDRWMDRKGREDETVVRGRMGILLAQIERERARIIKREEKRRALEQAQMSREIRTALKALDVDRLFDADTEVLERMRK